VLGGLFVTWGLVAGVARLSDNSFFTHLATGRRILDAGDVPGTDPYSFTATGEPWTVQSWLASLCYGIVDQLGGPVGLRLFSGVLVAAIGGLCWRLARPATSLVPRLAVVGLSCAVGSTFWAPRPLLFGLLGMALVYVVVDEPHDPRWCLPLLALWLQLHGSWPLGIVLIGCLLVARRFDGEPDGVERWALVYALAGVVLGGVANPIGPGLVTFPVTLLGRSDVLAEVIEWQSPDFTATFARLFLLQVAVAVVALVRTPSYRSALPMVVFVSAALLGLRNMPVAALVLLPGMARGFAGLGSLQGRQRSPATVVAALAVAAAAVVATVGMLQKPSYDLRAYPVDALAWADQAELLGPDRRLLATETAGNLIGLAYGPERAPVFVDDRVDMYPVQVVDDFLVLLRGQAGWREALRRWDVDVVVWEQAAPLSELLRAEPEWAVTYQDPRFVVFCRRADPACGRLVVR
jgi:hypothetical protein